MAQTKLGGMPADPNRSRPVFVCAAAVAGALCSAPALAEVNGLSETFLQLYDGTSDGTARATRLHDPLPVSQDDVAAKARLDRLRRAALGERTMPNWSGRDGVAAGAPAAASTPAIVNGINVPGLTNPQSDPSDSTGAIGPASYLQMVNGGVEILARASPVRTVSGTLNQLAGLDPKVTTFDPQVVFDPGSNRFFYSFDATISSSQNDIAWGFSKTNNPANLTTDWCRYLYTAYGKAFPDYPKLGNSRYFSLLGVNVYAYYDASGKAPAPYLGSDIIAIGKPPAASVSTCPAASSLMTGRQPRLGDAAGVAVSSPIPSSQVDVNETGYVVARASMPGGVANKLWFFSVTQDAVTKKPVFGPARGVQVPNYRVPASAVQPPTSLGRPSPTLKTCDARMTQAVQAFNPRTRTFSFWTQHSIDKLLPSGAHVVAVRYYELNPVPATPVVVQWGNIATPYSDHFNASISPDRAIAGGGRYGDSFVVQYTRVGVLFNLYPSIEVASSYQGAPLTTAPGAPNAALSVKAGVAPYLDYLCTTAADTCRWGDYSGLSPDPYPTTTGRGAVWGTNQFSGVANPSPSIANWRTQIFAVAP